MSFFGLDVGTSNLVSAYELGGKILYKKVRDAFYVINLDKGIGINPLQAAGVSYLEQDGKIFLLGDDAVRFAAGQNQQARRPMKNGLISDIDLEAEGMMIKLLSAVTSNIPEGSIVKFSIPAKQLGADDSPLVIHSEIIQDILQTLGFKGSPINEAACVVLSELAELKFTGLAISAGGGLINSTICNLGQPLSDFTFSIQGSGDKIDQIVANSLRGLGVSTTSITLAKERMSKEKRGIYNPAGRNSKEQRIEKGIASAYKSIIDNFVDNLEMVFATSHNIPNFEDKLAFVVAGGTALMPGFCDYLNEAMARKKFPIEIDQAHLASEPLDCVAKGALIAARLTNGQSI